MRVADFPLLNSQVFVVSLEHSGSSTPNWQLNAETKLWSDSGTCWLSQGETPVEVRPQSAGIEIRLERKELPWVLRSSRGGNLCLQCAEPADWVPLVTPLEICVDEKIAEQLSRAALIDRADVSLAVGWCAREFLFDGDPQRLAAVRFESASPSNWQIIGASWRAYLQMQPDGRVLLNRVSRTAQEIDSWSLVQGCIRFVDVSVATQLMGESQQAVLRQAIESNGDYVDLWKKYSEQEWQKSLRQAAALGVLQYKKREEAYQVGGAWRFYVDQTDLAAFRLAWQDLENDASVALEVGSNLPDWGASRYQDLNRADNSRRFRGWPRFERSAVVIESDRSVPPENGFLYLSLAGDRTVQERRQRALQNINTLPRSIKLRYILQGVNVPVPRPAHVEPMSRSARACFKSGKPTDKQIDAIRMALETPDVALIIGPPGTGKTQVIAALSRRLGELGGKAGLQHQVLITSFQHDAVENALERTQVFDLPPIKVGANRSGDEADPVQQWCEKKYRQLDSILEEQGAREAHVGLLRELHRDLATLRHAQLDIGERLKYLADIDKNLQKLEHDHRIRIPRMLQDEWRQYREQTLRQSPHLVCRDLAGINHGRRLALKAARAIRVTPVGFFDDGSDRATAARLAILSSGIQVSPLDLASLAELEERALLDEAEALEAAKLRDRIIDALLPDFRPPSIRHQLDAEGLRLIGAIEEALAEKIKSTRFGVSSVLTRYRDTFLHHPSRTRQTVREYATIVGATCQQSASVDMANLKALSEIGDHGIVFDTVIIDEAARANPLDLFIPISMAGRRVVLVGDHRQLPHLLEPEVEDELAETHDLSNEQRKAFAQSLFERLWNQLKDRTAKDGFPRVVMLDRQFRMHPILGDFVSKQFYEKEGLPALLPGRDASDFMSDISGYENAVCAWLDLPLSSGTEGRRGSSRIRMAEAQVIAYEVQRLLENCKPEVSIGVITFYSAQRDVIFEELSNLGISERHSETGAWQVAESCRLTPSGEEKLRIGTVDAFQGKEFDIVLLSIVRANNKRLPLGQTSREFYEKAANSKYGHLRLSNRMNVAMSRQRSLLIAVGDKAMATGGGAEAAVPALAAFLALCEGEHGVVR